MLNARARAKGLHVRCLTKLMHFAVVRARLASNGAAFHMLPERRASARLVVLAPASVRVRVRVCVPVHAIWPPAPHQRARAHLTEERASHSSGRRINCRSHARPTGARARAPPSWVCRRLRAKAQLSSAREPIGAANSCGRTQTVGRNCTIAR